MEQSDVYRRAYIAGARDAFDAMFSGMAGPEAQAMRHWIEVDLSEWEIGEPVPPPPHEWSYAFPGDEGEAPAQEDSSSAQR